MASSNLPKTGQAWAIAIDDGTEREPDVLCSLEAPAPDKHYKKYREILLIKGGWPKETNRLVEVHENSRFRVMVTDDEKTAVGYFINIIEMHSNLDYAPFDIEENPLEESKVHSTLKQTISGLYTEYKQWEESLSITDRRLRLLDQAEEDTKQVDFYKPVLENGSWRNSSDSLTPQEIHRVNQFNKKSKCNPKFCYKNARNAIEKWWKDPNAAYVEGIALSKTAARITGHAWVEINGKVTELTWPWHTPDPPKEAVYFGVEVTKKELEQKEEQGPYVLKIEDKSRLG